MKSNVMHAHKGCGMPFFGYGWPLTLARCWLLKEIACSFLRFIQFEKERQNGKIILDERCNDRLLNTDESRQ